MSSYVSVGYLQPQPDRVSSGEIQFVAGGHQPADRRMPDWHYLSDVSVEWLLSVDLPGSNKTASCPTMPKSGWCWRGVLTGQIYAAASL